MVDKQHAAIAVLALFLGGGLANPSFGQTPAPSVQWSTLSEQEQSALLPLAERWNGLDGVRQKKWLAVARRFQDMSAEEQYRLQEKMAAWAALTPEQRRMARERYRALSKMHPDSRQALKEKWAEYDALSLPEKTQLAKPSVLPSDQRQPPQPAGQPLSAKQAPATPPITLVPQPVPARP